MQFCGEMFDAAMLIDVFFLVRRKQSKRVKNGQVWSSFVHFLPVLIVFDAIREISGKRPTARNLDPVEIKPGRQ